MAAIFQVLLRFFEQLPLYTLSTKECSFTTAGICRTHCIFYLFFDEYKAFSAWTRWRSWHCHTASGPLLIREHLVLTGNKSILWMAAVLSENSLWSVCRGEAACTEPGSSANYYSHFSASPVSVSNAYFLPSWTNVNTQYKYYSLSSALKYYVSAE